VDSARENFYLENSENRVSSAGCILNNLQSTGFIDEKRNPVSEALGNRHQPGF